MRKTSWILFFVFNHLLVAQTIPFEKIDSLIRSKMNENRIVGLSLGIVREGKTVYTQGYGFTSLKQDFPVTNQTVFLSASITKLFTATAIMQMVERGEIHLTDKIQDILPNFRMKDQRYKTITIEHLLTHSSGLPWEHVLENSPNDSTALALFVASLKTEKLRFMPGTKMDGSTYSNVAYSILGLIIQQKSGLTYSQYLQKYLFKPSKMTECYLSKKDIPIEWMAKPHWLSGTSKEIKRFNLYGEIRDIHPVKKYPENPIVESTFIPRTMEHDPAGGVYLSADALCLWMEKMLQIYADSSSSSTLVLSRKSLLEMWSLKRNIPTKLTSIGLGWWRYADPQWGDYLFHVGREPGYCSILLLNPDQKWGITILCNGMYADQLVWNELPGLILSFLE